MSDGSWRKGAGQAFCRTTTRRAAGSRSCFGGFTLVELLVVIAIIATLAAILFPVLTSAKEAGRRARCSGQARELGQAILLYTDDNNGVYVPAAPDIDGPGGGLRRWHGVRPAVNAGFDPQNGPLWKYFGRSKDLKSCPTAAKMCADVTTDPTAFESGCGGFGYNAQYVGGTAYRNEFPESVREASATSDMRRPERTVMLADTAMAKSGKQLGPHLIEYSFAEPPYQVQTGSDGVTRILGPSSPSIHFRHDGLANVVWCDGHVSTERMSFTVEKNIYGQKNSDWSLGWFGGCDNSLFDNK